MRVARYDNRPSATPLLRLLLGAGLVLYRLIILRGARRGGRWAGARVGLPPPPATGRGCGPVRAAAGWSERHTPARSRPRPPLGRARRLPRRPRRATGRRPR